jgi:hypothetical protein
MTFDTQHSESPRKRGKPGRITRRQAIASIAAVPALAVAKPPVSPFENQCEMIRAAHRKRRYCAKLQQKIDRGMESYLRREFTDWNPAMPEAEREKCNKLVKKMISDARKGDGNSDIMEIVQNTDASRRPTDEMRYGRRNLQGEHEPGIEATMIALAEQLPVFEWIDGIRGAGALGLATIIGEAGPLDRYDNPAKLWKRLGYAPYQGFAGSSWKRESWRPRALTAEEWIANPFSGERYAQMHEIATWLVNAQWISAKRREKMGEVDVEEGMPNGTYGEIYANRRAHTAKVHPDWSKMHSRNDALRVAFKAFLKDLWVEWRLQAAIARPNCPPTDKSL